MLIIFSLFYFIFPGRSIAPSHRKYIPRVIASCRTVNLNSALLWVYIFSNTSSPSRKSGIPTSKTMTVILLSHAESSYLGRCPLLCSSGIAFGSLRIPACVVTRVFVPMQVFPQSPEGKLDRRVLANWNSLKLIHRSMAWTRQKNIMELSR